ncbi:MAG: hypothetical protein AAGE84_29800 [Cyanobacteria bacterium P01_G01_bin.39]
MNEFTITQLTDNDIDDTSVQTSNGNAVWSANDGNDTEIFFYDGNSNSQITDNEVFDDIPQISGTNLVWQRTERGSLAIFDDSQIIFYDGTTSNSIANVAGSGIPTFAGNNIVWGEDWTIGGSIFLSDGTNTSELTTSGTFVPVNSNSVSGDNIVWSNSIGQEFSDIFFYDGMTTTQITDNNLRNILPSVSGSNIAWTGTDGFTENDTGTNAFKGNETGEVFFYNGTETIQLTDDDVEDKVIDISGNNVIWFSGDSALLPGLLPSSELFLYDGTDTIKLTSDETESFAGASISGNKVVWSENDGNDTEIFLYDGNTTTQITDNDVEDIAPNIDGNSIVWESNDGNDTEIFLATLEILTGDENDAPSTVYRFLNNDTGVHFYTANEAEKNTVEDLANFSFEGASYSGADPLTGAEDTVPVYRFLNENTGVHLYTISENERGAVAELENFSFEGEVFSAYETEIEGSIPIYRFFNSTTGAHFYTPSVAERDNIENNLPDYQSEGIAYYALPINTEF